MQIAARTFYAWLVRGPSRRALWEATITEILAGYYEPDANGRRRRELLYGATKMWAHLRRNRKIPAARCTVERLMRRHGWQGVRRTKKNRRCQVVCVNTSKEVSTDDGCVASERGTPEASGLGSEQPVTAREAVDKMVQAGLLDDLLNQVDAGGLQLTGEGGFLPELVKRVLEAGLDVEMTGHLGYEKHDRAGYGSGNSRNGFTPKRLGTEVGDIELATPRDRNGSFEPRLVPKGQRRVGGLSDMIISLYAGGMTIRDIQAHLERTLGTQLSHETISNITDAVLDEVTAWQSRPLEPVYPILYLDALVVKVKDSHQVRNKAAHLAVGVDTDGIKHVLGIWVQASEGAKFWAGVLAELRNRGVKDVLIACCDGLTGFPEAIEATWPQTVVQTCVVHLIRASMRFISYQDRKAVAAALRPIYTAATEAAAAQELDIFEGCNWGKKYPATVRVWRDAWQRFIPFLEFPPAVRKIIYTTNSIESLNYQLRKIIKNRGHFPNDEAVIKLLWLAIRDIEDKRARERAKQAGRPKGQRPEGAAEAGRRRDRAGLERRLRGAQPGLPRPTRTDPVTEMERPTISGEAHTAGFLPDQPIPAGAQPRSTRPTSPAAADQGLTAASTGTPSQPEEPRLTKIKNRLHRKLDRLDLLGPHHTPPPVATHQPLHGAASHWNAQPM